MDSLPELYEAQWAARPLASTMILLAGVAFTVYAVSLLQLHFMGPKAPLIGANSFLEPRFTANLRFFFTSRKMMNEGYAKFKDSVFWFARNDANMMVIPNKHIDEIRDLPHHVANPTRAHAHNLLGPFTQMDIINKSDLHFRMIQTKLTPNLAQLVGPMQDELEYALSVDLPDCRDKWIEIQPYHTVLALVARMSARVFVGLPYCRNETWLEISTQFTENIFKSLLVMRSFPTWMHPLLGQIMPTIRANSRYIKAAQRLLLPEIQRRKELLALNQNVKSDATLLAWMIECAEGLENDPNHLAHLEVVVSLASIHTTQMNAVHCMLDLATHPEYLQPLRDEITEARRSDKGWKKSSFSRLRKLDSFLKESQRFNPPSLLSYHRLMQQDHVLSDGTLLPKDAHICMAVSNIQNDPDNIANPSSFDPFRYERLRQAQGAEHMHQFVTTTKSSLNFGHGKYACPGRFFASLEIKSIMVRMIMNYDFKLLDGQSRPANLEAYEFIFPNPESSILIKERPKELQLDFSVD